MPVSHHDILVPFFPIVNDMMWMKGDDPTLLGKGVDSPRQDNSCESVVVFTENGKTQMYNTVVHDKDKIFFPLGLNIKYCTGELMGGGWIMG